MLHGNNLGSDVDALIVSRVWTHGPATLGFDAPIPVEPDAAGDASVAIPAASEPAPAPAPGDEHAGG